MKLKYKKLKASEYPESLLTKNRTCYFCGKTTNLQCHHIYNGSFRNKSSFYGCWCWLCFDHHQGNNGVHNNLKLMRKLQEDCQRVFEEKYPNEEFLKIFGRNYI